MVWGRRKGTVLVLSAFILAGAGASAAAFTVENRNDQDMKFIRNFVKVGAELRESGDEDWDRAEPWRLDRQTQKCFKDYFPGLEVQPLDRQREADMAKHPLHYGVIDVKVWTERENYSVAYYVECKLRNCHREVWSRAKLGCCDRSSLESRVRKCVEELMGQLSIAFFESRPVVKNR